MSGMFLCGVQKSPSTELLEAPPCSFSIGVTYIASEPFFSFFSLSTLENYSFIFLVVGISTLISILLIFDFWS
jgi:hypothetical protein